ncbi:MAG: hypothetical protein GF329_17235 [Candidatus Lokiarchaeota archaeon]|nr:hypothetical protein [Candidatus Lokiarchaeota archaeon]
MIYLKKIKLNKKNRVSMILLVVLIFSAFFPLLLGSIQSNSPMYTKSNFPSKLEKSNALIDFQQEWNKTWGGINDTYSLAIAKDSNDNIYVIGYDKNTGGGDQDIYLRKYSPSGDLNWSRTWSTDRDESAYDIGIDANNNIYIVGYYSSGGGATQNDLVILKYSVEGNLINNFTYEVSGDQIGYALAIKNEYIYVAVKNKTASSYPTALFIKFDSNLTLKWCKNWDPGADTTPQGISIYQNHIYFTGETKAFSGSGYVEPFIVKYDVNGNQVYAGVWGDDSTNSWGKDILIDSEGNGFLLGRKWNYGFGTDLLISRFDTSVNYIWNRTWGDSKNEAGYSVVAQDEILYSCGSTSSYGSGSRDLLFIIYDYSGNQLYYSLWGGSDEDISEDIVVIGDEIYICGYTKSYAIGGYDGFLLKLKRKTTETTIPPTEPIPSFQLSLVLLSLIIGMGITIIILKRIRYIK